MIGMDTLNTSRPWHPKWFFKMELLCFSTPSYFNWEEEEEKRNRPFYKWDCTKLILKDSFNRQRYCTQKKLLFLQWMNLLTLSFSMVKYALKEQGNLLTQWHPYIDPSEQVKHFFSSFHHDNCRREKHYDKVQGTGDLPLPSLNKSKVVSTNELPNYCQRQHANGDHGFQQEFEV